MEVRRREEQVVGDDRERRGRGHAGEEAERHRHGGHRRQPEQGHVERVGQLGIPRGVGLVEGVAVGPPVQGVGEERLEVQEHGRARQHPQQRERAHAHATAEQLVQPREQPAGLGRRADRGRVHPAPSRTRLRRTSTWGGSALCQEVTLASR